MIETRVQLITTETQVVGMLPPGGSARPDALLVLKQARIAALLIAAEDPAITRTVDQLEEACAVATMPIIFEHSDTLHPYLFVATYGWQSDTRVERHRSLFDRLTAKQGFRPIGSRYETILESTEGIRHVLLWALEPENLRPTVRLLRTDTFPGFILLGRRANPDSSYMAELIVDAWRSVVGSVPSIDSLNLVAGRAAAREVVAFAWGDWDTLSVSLALFSTLAVLEGLRPEDGADS